MIYDVAILGGGPAGLSAALYIARRRLNAVLVTKEIGGQALWAGNVENYLGTEGLPGMKLVQNFQKHVDNYAIKKMFGKEIEKIEKNKDIFSIYFTNDEYIESKTVIICAGQTPRKLSIPGEKEFEKKGVAFCATCDAPLFDSKDVAVIGGGNAALDAALQLDKYANKIYLVNINPDFIGEKIRLENVKKSKKIVILNETDTERINGTNFVESIEVKNKKSGEKQTLAVNGVFIEIGSLPASSFAKELIELNEKGEIIIDNKNETNVSGIFAAGDITDVPYKQIIIAAGEGAKAALSCAKYLSSF